MLPTVTRNLFLIVALSFTCFVDSAQVQQSLRLPRNLIPTHYRIKLIPFLKDGNFTTNGEVWITLSCQETSNYIVFNNNNMTINKKSVSVQDLGSEEYISVLDQEYNNITQKYSLMVTPQLQVGHQYLLHIQFISYLNDLLEGLYRSSYVDRDTGERRWLASSQFSPTDARRAFPSWDEPIFKANFTVSLGRQSHLQSWSNMPINSTTPIEGLEGWVWDNYPPTVPMSTYLVAFMVSDLQSSGTVVLPSGLKFQTIARKDEISHTKYAAFIGPKVLIALEDYFKIKFPLPKLDMVAVPDFGFLAMENWGFITFRESVLLYDPSEDSIIDHDEAARVIAHELAHQWFGNLVTPAWWEDLWLKEGFATYIGWLAVNQVEAERRYKERFLVDVLQTVMVMDSLLSSHQISVPLDEPKDITQIFDGISYEKGASVIRMMHHFIGASQFRAGLTSYLKKYAYNNTCQDQLWQVLTEHRNESDALTENVTVKHIMDSWTLQVGYPVITISRDYESGSANLTQNRFLFSKEGDNKSLWWVPVSYTTQREANFHNTKPRLWLSNKDRSTRIKNIAANEWLLVNINQTGFYRVNYDERNWALLTSDFESLPDVTRAQLLNDVLNLAAAGQTPYSVALEMTKQLYNGHSYITWAAVQPQIVYMHSMLVGTSAYPSYKKYVLSLLKLKKMKLNLDPSSIPDDVLDRLHHSKIMTIALDWNLPSLVHEVKTLSVQWMAGTKPRISPDLRQSVYCCAVANGDEKVWQFLWSVYLNTSKVTERAKLLYALGCSKDTSILLRYLNLLLDENSNIRKQDGTILFASVANNQYGYHLAFDFLTNRWRDIQNYFGLGFNRVSSMVLSLSQFLKTPHQLKQLEALQTNHSSDLGSTAQAMRRTIEMVSNNVAWCQSYYQEVEEWLSRTIST